MVEFLAKGNNWLYIAIPCLICILMLIEFMPLVWARFRRRFPSPRLILLAFEGDESFRLTNMEIQRALKTKGFRLTNDQIKSLCVKLTAQGPLKTSGQKDEVYQDGPLTAVHPRTCYSLVAKQKQSR